MTEGLHFHFLSFCDCGFHWSALWWIRIRGLWKLPDWGGLRGKLGLVLMGGATLRKSNPIFCWWAGLCFLPVVWPEAKLRWRQWRQWHALLHSVPPVLLRGTTTDPRLRWRLLDTHGEVWVSLLWGHSAFLLGPGAHKVLFVLFKRHKI